jgi:hypothetical protein
VTFGVVRRTCTGRAEVWDVAELTQMEDEPVSARGGDP